MGLRGPKTVHVGQLKAEAVQWATFLYALRDGQSGFVERVQGPWRTVKAGRLRGRMPSGTLGVKIIPLDRNMARKFIKAIRKPKHENWIIFPPTFPNPQAWKRLKRARTGSEVRRAADRIRRWASQFSTGIEWSTTLEHGGNFSSAIRKHARELLRAKRMPNYPRRQASNDDKRILFFAKVMSGLTLGLAPATATKRLGHWRWPADWAEKSLKEFVWQHPMPTRKSTEQEKLK